MVFLARNWYSLNYGIARFFPDSVHPLPALLLTPFFARSLTLVPRSLLLNRAETLATQATLGVALEFTSRTPPPPPHQILSGLPLS